eukprot:TRINITY_DN11965_c0_g1_i1.p1 TRINITY_DN11965_c0_g1~~TRINITY_DN11965_c0_g1_i1.p1  ORF type:complete len:1752 (+),score=260.98 TRINITY_DN11965_c0_g1_i1:311-5257(+)
MPTATQSLIDPVLSLHGRSMIFGRGLLIENESTGTRYCAPIGFDRTDFKMVVARFANDYIGSITLRQGLRSNSSETIVEIDLRRAQPDVEANNMEYHIHVNPISDTQALDGECSQAGGHFDPFEVDQSNYLNDCGSGSSPSDASSGKGYQLFCELGDLSGKHGMLKFGNSSRLHDIYVDLQLPLFGPFSVASKSIVIHHPLFGTPLACASMREVKARTAVAILNSTAIRGSVTMTQQSPYHPTSVTFNLTGLNGFARGVKIGTFATEPALGDRKCSAAAIGGVFDPFRVTPGMDVRTSDLDKVGSFAAFGSFLNVSLGLNGLQLTDYNLPLFGIKNVMGRGLALLGSGSELACADIGFDTDMSEIVLELTGAIEGRLTLLQAEADYGRETLVRADIYYFNRNTLPTNNHNWFIHTEPLAGSDCGGVIGPVFNPYNVSESFLDCTPSDPLSCASGNLATKVGRLGIGVPREKRIQAFTLGLPVTGQYSVSGRPLIINAAETQPARRACANLPGIVIKRTTIAPTTSTRAPTPEPVRIAVYSTMRIRGVEIGGVSAAQETSLRAIFTSALRVNCNCSVLVDRFQLQTDRRRSTDPTFEFRLRFAEALRETVRRSLIFLQLDNDFLTQVRGIGGMATASSLVITEPTDAPLVASTTALPTTTAAAASDESSDSLTSNPIVLGGIGAGALVLMGLILCLLVKCRKSDVDAGNKLAGNNVTNFNNPIATNPSMHAVNLNEVTYETLPESSTMLHQPVLTKPDLPPPRADEIELKDNNLHSSDSDDSPPPMRHKTSAALDAPQRASRVKSVMGMNEVAVAEHDYDAEDDTQLSFKEGDRIEVLEKADSGWCKGLLGGASGWFPGTYVNFKPFETDVDDLDDVSPTYTSNATRAKPPPPVRSTPDAVRNQPDPPQRSNSELSASAADNHVVKEAAPALKPPSAIQQQLASVLQNKLKKSPALEASSSLDDQESLLKTKADQNMASGSDKPNTVPASDHTKQPAPVAVKPDPQAADNEDKDVRFAVSNFEATGDDQVSLKTGERAVITSTSDNGWAYATVGEKRGWIPESTLSKTQPTHYEEPLPASNSGKDDDYALGEKHRVIYDYQARDAGDLALKVGDEIIVLEKGSDGWWRGCCDEREGWFPGSYCEPATHDESYAITPAPGAVPETSSNTEASHASTTEPAESASDPKPTLASGSLMAQLSAKLENNVPKASPRPEQPESVEQQEKTPKRRRPPPPSKAAPTLKAVATQEEATASASAEPNPPKPTRASQAPLSGAKPNPKPLAQTQAETRLKRTDSQKKRSAKVRLLKPQRSVPTLPPGSKSTAQTSTSTTAASTKPKPATPVQPISSSSAASGKLKPATLVRKAPVDKAAQKTPAVKALVPPSDPQQPSTKFTTKPAAAVRELPSAKSTSDTAASEASTIKPTPPAKLALGSKDKPIPPTKPSAKQPNTKKPVPPAKKADNPTPPAKPSAAVAKSLQVKPSAPSKPKKPATGPTSSLAGKQAATTSEPATERRTSMTGKALPAPRASRQPQPSLPNITKQPIKPVKPARSHTGTSSPQRPSRKPGSTSTQRSSSSAQKTAPSRPKAAPAGTKPAAYRSVVKAARDHDGGNGCIAVKAGEMLVQLGQDGSKVKIMKQDGTVGMVDAACLP